jgi:hypothetical protein
MPTKPNLPVASLCLYGAALDSALISRVLNCEPSYSQTNGESFISVSGNRRISETGLWMVHSDRFCTSSNANEHVQALLEALKLHLNLRTLEGVDVAVMSLAMLSGEQPELVSLSPQLLARLAELGLALKIEAY